MKILNLLSVALITLTSCAQSEPIQNCLTLDMEQMVYNAKEIKSGSESGKQLLSDVLKKANKAMKGDIYCVMDKDVVAPSGDKHDFTTSAPYWWLDTTKNDGSYVYRDGEVNPEWHKYTDQAGIAKTVDNVQSLGIAYYYTGDDKYAERAEAIVQKFFLDEATRMNPNMNFSQYIPGQTTGRPAGVIAAAGMNRLLEGAILSSASKEWSIETTTGMQAWCREFITWLTTSDLGVREGNTRNNHGTNYDALCVSLYIYADDKDGAINHIQTKTLPRIEQQVAADGSQPEELRRTKSWNYTTMNLAAYIRLADMANTIGFDLWNYTNNGQKYMKSMIDWFIPYLTLEKEWTWRQIIKEPTTRINPTLEKAAKMYGDDIYIELMNNPKTLGPNIFSK